MSGGLHSLATIIKRLEAATTRIEDLAEHAQRMRAKNAGADPIVHGATSPTTPKPAPTAGSSSAHETPLPVPKTVTAFDELVIAAKLNPFLQLTRSFTGSSVIEQAALVEKEFADLRALLLLASSCQKPDDAGFGDLLGPLQKDILAITKLKEANRKDRDWFTHLSTVAEGAPCAGWVTVPKPGPYVNEIIDSTLFYGNRVIKEYKEKDVKHAEWVRAYVAVLEELRKYIMEYHTTGLAWNTTGVPVSEYKAPSASIRAGIPPPPPPPPPAAPPAPAVLPASAQLAPTASGGVAAVFADLNRGEDVTKGLRKVDKSEMTHKNPALRASGTVPSSSGGPSSPSAGKKPIKPTKPFALSGKKPPKFALDGNKWVIEYQENESGLVVEDVMLNQSVNLFGCKNSTVIIKGKVNAVSLLNCTKTSVLVESAISAVSVTKSPSFELQITGHVPTIQLDSTDSGQIFLSKDCLNVEITTAKCSAINISLPVVGEDEGVFTEQAVPEMLKTVVVDGILVTTVVEHVG